MHKASAEYFKHRSLYSRAELNQSQALSHQSDRKIRTAQVSVHIRVKTGGGGGDLDGESPQSTFMPGVGFLANGGVFPSYHSGSVLRSALSGLHPASRLPCVSFAKQGRPGRHPLGAPPQLQPVRSLIRWLTRWTARLPEHLCSSPVSVSSASPASPPTTLCVRSILCSVTSH